MSRTFCLDDMTVSSVSADTDDRRGPVDVVVATSHIRPSGPGNVKEITFLAERGQFRTDQKIRVDVTVLDAG